MKGIDFLIDFDIDFKTAPDGPKTPQDGPRRRSKRQDGLKRPPRRPQDGPKRPQKFGVFYVLFLILAAKSPQGPPETSPRLIFGAFLVDFLSNSQPTSGVGVPGEGARPVVAAGVVNPAAPLYERGVTRLC